MRPRSLVSALAPAALVLACSDTNPATPPRADAGVDTGTPAPARVRMDFTRTDGFWSAPFPDENRRRPNGTVDLAGFPNLRNNAMVRTLTEIASRDPDGFGLTSAIYFTLTAPIDPSSLPDLRASVTMDSPVLLIPIDRDAPDFGRPQPLVPRFDADGGPYGAPNLLALLPLQGVPLRPHRRYAAVVRTSLRGADGTPLQPAPEMAMLRGGTAPPGMRAEVLALHRTALDVLRERGVSPETIAGLTVFTTADPAAELLRGRDNILARPRPAPLTPFARREVFADYCVYESALQMPVFQQGEPPYMQTGGGWVRGADGNYVWQRDERARIFVTVPRRAMPARGFPTVVFVRTGGGGERPLVDRGRHPTAGGEAEPGTGPAREFARAGLAGVSVDGPHGGVRNVTRGDEQFLVFNVSNPPAMRDNIRQSAIELALVAHVTGDLRIDVSDCPGVTGATEARFDTETLALVGHSTGSVIATLTAAIEPRYRAVVLSGAGGSWSENIVHKLRPIAARPVAELLLGYNGIGRTLHTHDAPLNLLQWAGEGADCALYGRNLIREPLAGGSRHVLMFQGIVDHYILPPIANALTVPLGVDLLLPERDRGHPEFTSYTPVTDLATFSGMRSIMAPARQNLMGVRSVPVTGVLAQHPADMVEDGHEVMFQTDAPKRQYRCFLESFVRGEPMVPGDGAIDAPCGG